MTITQADGYPVQPAATGSVRIAMGERYDAIVTLSDGVFPLVARPVGKRGVARALVRTASGASPFAGELPEEFDGTPLAVVRLKVAGGAALPAREQDRTLDLVLGGSMGRYVWTINGRTYDDTVPLTVRGGAGGAAADRQPVDDAPPVHMHGHTFQLGAAAARNPARTPC